MIQLQYAVILGILLILFGLILSKIDWKKYKNNTYYEMTVLLGSGGHTGQLCQLLNHFKINKLHQLNVIITSSDKSSENFFTNYLKKNHSQNYNQIVAKTNIIYLARTNEVKQSYFTAIFTTLYSLLSSTLLIINKLINTTHFIANGPGTCVPLYMIFLILKTLKISKVKLIYIQSWCRVKELSLTGKIVRFMADQFIVHWPELAAKYSFCKYYERII